MPVTYRFDSNIIVIQMIGEYSMNDIRQAILNSFADSVSPAVPFLMFDLAESQSIGQRSREDVKALIHFIASLGKQFNHRLAMVASNDLPYGLMRMYSIEADDWGIKAEVFRTFADARNWLLS